MAKSKRKPPKVSSDGRCPVCGKRWYYYRVRFHDYLCRYCGTVFEMNLSTGRTIVKTGGNKNGG